MTAFHLRKELNMTITPPMEYVRAFGVVFLIGVVAGIAVSFGWLGDGLDSHF